MNVIKRVLLPKKSVVTLSWILVLLLFFPPALLAQNNGQAFVKGLITNKAHQPISNASGLLLRAKDSSLVKGSITDANGGFVFSNIPFGNYYVTASMLQYLLISSSTILITAEHLDINVPSLILQSETRQLEAVVVSAKKPLFEQKIDRMVINVASSITSVGSTALEARTFARGNGRSPKQYPFYEW